MTYVPRVLGHDEGVEGFEDAHRAACADVHVRSTEVKRVAALANLTDLSHIGSLVFLLENLADDLNKLTA